VQTELMGAPWTGWMRALAKRPVGRFLSDPTLSQITLVAATSQCLVRV